MGAADHHCFHEQMLFEASSLKIRGHCFWLVQEEALALSETCSLASCVSRFPHAPLKPVTLKVHGEHPHESYSLLYDLTDVLPLFIEGRKRSGKI